MTIEECYTRGDIEALVDREKGLSGAPRWSMYAEGGVIEDRNKYPLNYTMAAGRGEIIRDETAPFSRIEAMNVNEHHMRWTYGSWAEWMEASSWSDLKENHTRL